MADSAVAITVGTGTNIDTRTEATNGNHRQVVVLGDPSTNAGVAPVDATNGLTVDLGTNNDVTVTGTVTANLSATDNTVLDNIETATEATQAAVETIDNAISGSEMQVDVVGALPAGTALLGKVGIDQVTANANEVVTKTGSVTTEANSSAIKTAVEALDNSVDGNYLNVNANIAGTDIVGGAGAVAAGVQRVTLASDDPAVASLGTLDNAISGSEMQVDVVASLPAGTNAIGKLAANSGVDIGDVDVLSIAAGNNNIGDVDVASIAAGNNNIGDVDVASIANGSINGPAAPVIDSYTHASINLNAGANQVLVSSSASHQIWVYGFGFTVNAAGSVSFQDEDDTAITGVMPIAANGGMVVAPSGNFAMPIWKLATDKDLEVDVVTSELDGWIDYAIVNA